MEEKLFINIYKLFINNVLITHIDTMLSKIATNIYILKFKFDSYLENMFQYINVIFKYVWYFMKKYFDTVSYQTVECFKINSFYMYVINKNEITNSKYDIYS